MTWNKCIANRTYDILQYLPLGVFVLRRDYTVIFWNNCLEAWTGITSDEISGTNLFEHFPHLDTPMYKGRLQDIFDGGPPIVFSSQLHKNIIPCQLPDGQPRIQHSTVISISFADEDEIAALFVLEDVTEMVKRIQDYRALRDKSMEEIKMRKLAEEALREYKAELEEQVEQRTKELSRLHTENKQLLETITSILISIDNKDRVTQWNKIAESTFNISRANVMGQSLHECGIQWQWDKIDAGIKECRSQRQSVRLDDIRFTRPDGSDGFVGLTVTPIENDMEQDGVLLFGADITGRKTLEMQLSQAQKLEAIGQLASGIAHEINTPIQYVRDNTRFLEDSTGDILNILGEYDKILKDAGKGIIDKDQILKTKQAIEEIDIDYLTEEIPNAVHQSLEGIERIAGIVGAMKNFAHPEVREKIPVDLNKAIESTVTVTRNEWKYVAVLDTDFDPDLPLVSCFPNKFNQVILNLIINAAHAIEDVVKKEPGSKGTITIATRGIDGWVEIRISDTGTGIPEEIRPRIFDLFFTTKEIGKGSGQGLAISRTIIVDKHGGELNFETETGKGSTFIIRLPVDPQKKDRGN